MINCVQDFISFLADVLTIIVAVLAIVAVCRRRKELFQSSLAQTQTRNLAQVIETVQEICLYLQNMTVIVEEQNTMGWSVQEIKTLCPENWVVVLGYRNKSMWLFQKLSFQSNYIFPDWVDRNELSKVFKVMKGFSPFTINSIQKKTREEIESYTQELLSLANNLETQLVSSA